MFEHDQPDDGGERKLKVAVIREELLAITGGYLQAIILNQMLYWCERTRDVDAYIAEESVRDPATRIAPTRGWIYKTADDLLTETMLAPTSRKKIRDVVSELVGLGFLEMRHNPLHPWDRTLQYRVNLRTIQRALLEQGYTLEGYGLGHLGRRMQLPAPVVANGSMHWNDRLNALERSSQCIEPNVSIESDDRSNRLGQTAQAIPETTVETTTKTTAAGSRVRANGAAHPPDEERGGGGGGDAGPPGDRGPAPPDVRSALIGRLTSEAKLRPKQAAAVVRSGLVSSDADVDRCVAFVQSSDAEKPPAVLWSEWLSQGQLPPAPEGQPPGRPTDAMSEAEILAFYDRMNRERYEHGPVPAGRGVP